MVVAAENAEDGVLGPEEESMPTRGDENSIFLSLFQILCSSRELSRCTRVPCGFAAHETDEVETLPSLHTLFSPLRRAEGHAESSACYGATQKPSTKCPVPTMRTAL